MSHYSTLKGLGRAIAYFPQLGIHLGNPLAGIFLSQLVYWHDKTDCELGVYKTSEEWQKETGLTYSHQKTARKLLKELGILSETEKRLEHKLYFKLNIEKFDEWFEKCINSDQNGESKTANPRTRNPSFGDEQKPHSGVKESFDRGEAESTSVIHNITTEITTENTSESVVVENSIVPEDQQPEQNSVEHTLKIWTPNLDSLNSWLQRSGLPKITQTQTEEILLEINPHYENKIITGAVNDTQMYSNFVKWIKRDTKLTEKLMQQINPQNQPVNPQNFQADMGDW